MLDMLTEHFGVIHLIDVVAREDEDIIRVIHFDKTHVLINGVGRAGKPRAVLACGLVRREDEHAAVGTVKIPRLTAADVAVQAQRAVLRQHAHGVYAGVCAVGKRKINDPVLAAKGHIRFCNILRQGEKA